MCDDGYADEPVAVWCPAWRTARKHHQCMACPEPIAPGDRYHYVSWVFDGSAGSYKHCARCWTMIEAITDAHDYDVIVDLDLACGRLWQDEIGELPDEVAALAFALPGDFADAGKHAR